MMPGLPDELQVAVLNAGSPARMADMIADSMSFSYPEKLLLLVLSEVRARQEFLAILLNRELEVMKLSMKIQSEVSQAMSQQQREFYLREQLRTIQEELGEDSRNPISSSWKSGSVKPSCRTRFRRWSPRRWRASK